MRKLLSSLMVLALGFSLFGAVASAEETPQPSASATSELSTQKEGNTGEVQSSEAEVKSPEDEQEGTEDVLITDIKDKSKEVSKDPVQVKVFYKPEIASSGFIPNFTISYRDNEGNVISTVKAGKQNYNAEEGFYLLSFPTKNGYKLDEEYQLMVDSLDPEIQRINFYNNYVDEETGDLLREEAKAKADQYYSFKVRSTLMFTDEAETKAERVLVPSIATPMHATLTTDSKAVIFKFKTSTGEVLKNTAITLNVKAGKSGEVPLKTDATGSVKVDTAKVPSDFTISAEGYEFKAISGSGEEYQTKYLPLSKPVGLTPELQDAALVYGITAVKTSNAGVATGSAKELGVTIDVKADGNSDLSNHWKSAIVTITTKDGANWDYTVDSGEGLKLALEDGTYTVAAKSETANASLSSKSLVIKDGKGKVTLNLTPKYTLEIDKAGKDYEFKVLNVASIADKAYKGTAKQVFAVSAGETYVVQDVKTGEVTTVAIDAKSTVTKLVLGAGVVFGGNASAPHTGDPILYLSIMMVVLLAGLAGLIVYYRKSGKNGKFGTKATSILLAVALLGGLFAPFGGNTVHAGTGSGTPAPVTGGKTSPSGVVQSSYVSLLRVGFIPMYNGESPGQKLLSTHATLSNMNDTYKFDNMYTQYEPAMVYIAPNQKAYDIFTNSNSSIMTFDYARGNLLEYKGNSQLYKDGDAPTRTSHSDIQKRVFLADDGLKNNNKFIQLVSSMVYHSGGTPANRELWANVSGSAPSGSTTNVGDRVSLAYDALVERYKNLDVSGNDFFEAYVKFFDGIDGSNKTNPRQTYLTDLIGKYNLPDQMPYRNVGLFVEVVQGFYVKDKTQASMSFLSLHDASSWYQYYRGQENKAFQNFNNAHEAKVIYYGSYGDGSQTSARAKLAPTSNYKYYTKPSNGAAVKPHSHVVKLVAGSRITNAALETNPFTGWGFVPWGNLPEGGASRPNLSIFKEVHYLDKNGKEVAKDTKVPLTSTGEVDWSVPQEMAGLTSVESDLYDNKTVYTRDGKQYNISPRQITPILRDTADGENLFTATKLTGNENGGQNNWSRPLSDTAPVWELFLGMHTPKLNALSAYLGGNTESGTLYSKYAGRTDASGKPMFSHAELIIPVYVQEDDFDKPSESEASHTVPEWRLSKYWNWLQVPKDGVVDARFRLTPDVQTGRNASITPASPNFTVLAPDLSGTPWLESVGKHYPLDKPSQIRSLVPTAPREDFPSSGNVLAIKTKDITNDMFASWYAQANPFGDRVANGVLSKILGKPNTSRNIKLDYNVPSNSSSYVYRETRTESYSYTDSEGKTQWSSRDYTHSQTLTPDFTAAVYDTNVLFLSYLPKATANSVKFSNKEESTNGLYWETNQESDNLSVVPEVAMLYNSNTGGNSVGFMAGSQKRPISPITYNKAEFVDVEVDPQLTGMSVATEQGAKALATAKGANGKEVIYKGSSTTTNFAVKGELKLKTFALDIGSSALKNAWNPNVTYNTAKLNEDFLARVAQKDPATGNWQVTLDGEGKYIIGNNGKEYGGATQKLTLDEKNRQEVIEHRLEVRGGRVIAVNGVPVANLSAELKEVLAQMHILGDKDKTVLNVFETRAGAKISGETPEALSLANAARHTSDWANGNGWYNEDSTVLVVREYVNTFVLPQYTYSDKLPMEVDNLKTPMDKADFFKVGELGYLKLSYALTKLPKAEMVSDTLSGQWTTRGANYVVPNVSVMDTFGSVQ